MNIQPVTTKEAWDIFLDSLLPNTFLQSWQWGQVQLQEGEDVDYLGFFEDGRQVGAALVITVRAKRGNYLLCPHGPLLLDEATIGRYLPEFVRYLKDKAVTSRAVALRVAPLLVDSQVVREVFKAQGFRDAPLHLHAELTWVLDISKPEETVFAEMRKTTRHAIKKAQAVGVHVEIIRDENALKRFWPLYQSTTVRHGFVPFRKEFMSRQLKEFTGDNHMFIAIATYQGRDVAGAILIHTGQTVFYYHGASKKLPADVPAAQLLQWQAIKEAQRLGATTYNFWGIAPENEPKHPFAGITVFKKGFGGYAINYIHAQDLPLNWQYWKLWLIETYRKYKRGF